MLEMRAEIRGAGGGADGIGEFGGGEFRCEDGEEIMKSKRQVSGGRFQEEGGRVDWEGFRKMPGHLLLTMEEVSLIAGMGQKNLVNRLSPRDQHYKPKFAEICRKVGKRWMVRKGLLERYLKKWGGITA